MRETRFAVAAAVVLLAGIASAAPAQESAGSTGTADFYIEEVVVTANRREQSLQEVPMSVTAFSSQFFADTGLTDFTELQQYTPSLKIVPGADSSAISVRIRGIGSVGTNAGVDPSVGIFIDGVYQGRSGMSIADLVDIERVEVLRGPQGTLYGKNTAAGAISIITGKPAPEFDAFAELEYASHDRKEARGMVNIPLGDSGHAARFTAFGVKGDHLYENTYTGEDLNDADKWGVRSRLLFDMKSAGELLLTLDYSEEDTDCCAFGVITYEGLSTLNSPLTNTPSAAWQEMLGLNAAGNYILEYKAFENTEGYSPPRADAFDDDYWLDYDPKNDVKVGGIAAEWNRQLESESTLTLIGAWRRYEASSVLDGDFTAYDAVRGSTDVELDQYSAELRLTSPGGQTWDYLVGLYAYYSEFDSLGSFEMRVPLVSNISVGPFSLAIFFPDGSNNRDSNRYTTTSYAGFGQLVWNIRDDLSLTMGLRYTQESKDRDGSQLTTPRPPFFVDIPPVAGPDVFYDESRSDSDVSPALTLRYFPTPDIMTYASISRGFKSGGFNQRREVVGSDGEFDEEIATNYEIGWKGAWLNNRLQINSALFLVNYDDFQSQAFDGSDIKVTNAGEMESYGLEFEALYALNPELTLGTSVGYTKATYDDFDNGQCTVEQAFINHYIINRAQSGSPGTTSPPCLQDLAGKPLDNSPEWTVSSYAQYRRPLGDKLAGSVRLEHQYVDSYYLEQSLDRHLRNDGVHLLNLRLSLADEAADWEVALWGKNLLAEKYYAYGINIPTVGGYAALTAPQDTYGVSVRRNF